MNLPQDFVGDANIAIIAFQRWHQRLVNGWIGFLKQNIPESANVEIYELPTLNRAWGLMRWMIDGGMRAGIHSKDTREHTITLYVKKGDFKDALGIEDESTIHVYLLDSDGFIHFHSSGEHSQRKGEELLRILTAHTGK